MMTKFKTIITEAGLSQFKISESIGSFIKDQHLRKMLNDNTKCVVRIYILEGFNFAQRDLFSLSDPYMKIKCGDT
jgi:Ca2+-dependent lipid-binding protein